MDKKPITVSTAGKRGGTKTASTHKHEFYQENRRRGGAKTAAGHDHSFFNEIGKQGGLERAKQREGAKEAEGKVSVEEVRRRGGQKVKRLIELGKNTRKNNW